MAEKLTARVGRIISGSIHGLMDAVENAAPEMVMQQAIREVDSVIDEVRAELGKVVAAEHLANKKLTEQKKRHQSLTEQMLIAVEKGRDDLAESAISLQLDIEAQIPVLEKTIADGIQQEKELEGYIIALQGQKREMQSELATYQQHMAQHIDTGNGLHPNSSGNLNQKVHKASAAFERVYQQKTGISAGLIGQNQNTTKLAELEKLSHEHRVKERLALLKAETK